MTNENARVIPFDRLRMTDLAQVGGKNASLGEMISQLAGAGIRVPGGFATTAFAFREFLGHENLAHRIAARLAALDVDDVTALAVAGAEIRRWLTEAPLPPALEQEIRTAYAALTADGGDFSFAVRSSATAEDLPDASFAGQQETFLNINGIDNIIQAIREVFASLYNDRAIAYRVHKGFAETEIALSAGVQRMVRSDTGAAGVMFTLDTESGFDKVVFITAAYGLGETVVQGSVNPDEFYVDKRNLAAGRPAILRKTVGGKAQRMVFTDARSAGRSTATVEVPAAERIRFSITDAEAEALGRMAMTIERHYGRPMDIEWGRDGGDGQLYILQARPETVKSQEESADRLRRYRLKRRSDVLASGRAIGQKIGQGRVRLIASAAEMARVEAGDVLVTEMTDPDWEPVMKRAAAIVTNRGGRTCHAAIIARELGIPAVVGCGDATRVLADGAEVTVSLRGRRHRPRLRGAAADRHRGRRARPDAAVADQDHDERRQSGARVRVPAAAQRRRRPRAPRVHHQPQRRHPPEGAARARPAAARSSSARSRRASRATRARPRSTCRRSPKASRRSPRRSSRRRSSCGCRTSSPTSTRTSSAATATSRTRKTRCWASAARRGTSRPSSTTASRSNARR